jgi:hypothetical protein
VSHCIYSVGFITGPEVVRGDVFLMCSLTVCQSFTISKLLLYLGVSHNRIPARPCSPEREARTRGALYGEMQSWLLEHSIVREDALQRQLLQAKAESGEARACLEADTARGGARPPPSAGAAWALEKCAVLGGAGGRGARGVDATRAVARARRYTRTAGGSRDSTR